MGEYAEDDFLAAIDDEYRRDNDPDYCPKCGEVTEVFFEGYCKRCRDERQRRLDEFNANFDRWDRMTDNERMAAIKRAAAE